MEDVTDTVFREIVMSISHADALNVLFTEFTNIDGLLDERGFEYVSERLIVSETEKELLRKRGNKLVAQIWGNDPEKFRKVAEYLTSLNLFDGIDINMGCPVKKAVKKNTCSALINVPELAKEIVLATMSGTDLPVSVKTRIGFKSVETERWISQLLETKPAAITLHGRIQSQQSKGLADWNEIAKAAALCADLNPATKIIGNGDVESYQSGIDKIEEHGINGIMVGRGIFKNPWMFNHLDEKPSVEQRLDLLEKHILLFEKQWSGLKKYNVLKRFFKIYINDFRGASSLRVDLMSTKTYQEGIEVLLKYRETLLIDTNK